MAEPPPKPSQSEHAHPNPVVRLFLKGVGLLACGLGFVGIFLPLLPTTPFLLLAAACFLRSSPRLHAWLLANRWFGPFLRQWAESRTVPKRAKVTAVLVTLATFGASIALVDPLGLRLMLVGIGAVVLVVVGRLRTA